MNDAAKKMMDDAIAAGIKRAFELGATEGARHALELEKQRDELTRAIRELETLAEQANRGATQEERLMAASVLCVATLKLARRTREMAGGVQ